MLGFDGEYPTVNPRAKFDVFRKKLQKIISETFQKNPYFA